MTSYIIIYIVYHYNEGFAIISKYISKSIHSMLPRFTLQQVTLAPDRFKLTLTMESFQV